MFNTVSDSYCVHDAKWDVGQETVERGKTIFLIYKNIFHEAFAFPITHRGHITRMSHLGGNVSALVYQYFSKIKGRRFVQGLIPRKSNAFLQSVIGWRWNLGHNDVHLLPRGIERRHFLAGHAVMEWKKVDTFSRKSTRLIVTRVMKWKRASLRSPLKCDMTISMLVHASMQI